MLKPRQCVVNLPPYRSPVTSRLELNLDLNENAWGCSPRVLATLQKLNIQDISRYPSREPAEQRAAEFLGVRPEQVVLTNGIDEGLQLLFSAYLEPGDEIIFSDPTFVMYPIVGAASGAELVRLSAGPGFEFPTAELSARISARTRVIAIANPNNPTGLAVPREELLHIVERAPNAAVLIDEAYYEFHGETLVDEIDSYPNLFVARTFSKAYGMAGFRLGILLGAAEQLGYLRRFASPFNVNAAAVACLEEALADQAFVAACITAVQEGRERLEKCCVELGLTFWPSRANFMLVRIGEQVELFVAKMMERGVAVRNMSMSPKCDGCVRITIGTREQMDRVIDAMRRIVKV